MTKFFTEDLEMVDDDEIIGILTYPYRKPDQKEVDKILKKLKEGFKKSKKRKKYTEYEFVAHVRDKDLNYLYSMSGTIVPTEDNFDFREGIYDYLKKTSFRVDSKDCVYIENIKIKGD